MTPFFLTHLYPKNLSIYGDYGNILAIKYRLKKLNLKPVYQTVDISEELPDKSDFILIGGGQDKEQINVMTDLQVKADKIKLLVESGTGLLSICGGYQLLGKKFLTGKGENVNGIGLFDVETKAPSSDVKARCVGNLIIKSLIPELIDTVLIGFENHSGQTYPVKNWGKCQPLGKVLTGFGNNLNAKYEGCVYKNAIGTYLHGSCLPKNPELTDWFIFKALKRKLDRGEISKTNYKNLKDQTLDDSIALKTKTNLIARFLKDVG